MSSTNLSMDRDQALALQRTGLRDWIAAMSESSPGARLFERDGVTANAAPACPQRGIVNSVSFTSSEAMLDLLDDVAEFEREAGVEAWELWIEDFDTETIAAVEERGLKFDGKPMAMTLDLASWRPPDLGDLVWDRDVDGATLGRLTDLAYGIETEVGMAHGLTTPSPSLRLYQARADSGEPVSVMATIDHAGDDLGIYLVATHPDHRGRGLASRLLAVALSEGRERGMKTSSLQGSPMGAPIYARLGYSGDFRMNLYEHRAGSG